MYDSTVETARMRSVHRWKIMLGIATAVAIVFAMLMGASTTGARPASNLAANEEVVRGYYDAINRGDAAAPRDMLHGESDAIGTDVADVRAVFPDLDVTVDELVAEGDIVAARVTYRGTHLGPIDLWFMGATLEPTGRPVTIGSMALFTIADGKITALEEQVDLLTFLIQAGVNLNVPDPTDQPAWTATARLKDVTGRELGVAFFAEDATGAMTVKVDGEGLTNGDHGLHVHETGTCDPDGEQSFSSAGGHFNPSGATHGEHAGDLDNLPVEGGWFDFTTTSDRFTLSPGADSILDADGSALVIHLNADDGVTDPAGNAGPRYACGVIVAGLTS